MLISHTSGGGGEANNAANYLTTDWVTPLDIFKDTREGFQMFFCDIKATTNSCKLLFTGSRKSPSVILVTQIIIVNQTLIFYPNPNLVFFVPNPNQSIREK